MFDELAEQNPDHFAVRQYAKYKLEAGAVCSKRLLNQAVGKSLRTHKPDMWCWKSGSSFWSRTGNCFLTVDHSVWMAAVKKERWPVERVFHRRCYQQTLSGWIFQNCARRVCWRKEYQMKIQLIDFGGRSPERTHANDAGADVFSPKDAGPCQYWYRILLLKTGRSVVRGLLVPLGDKENLFTEILLDFKW